MNKPNMKEANQSVKGYKIFNPDFTCRGHQFSENSIHELELPIEICGKGFHFCLKASHIFNYYSFDPKNIVCEVEALGEVKTHHEDSKACTNILKIGRRLTWEEVLQVANEGANNTGHSNTGDRNTGDRNTGDRNTGYSNTGNRNTGNWNTGYSNTGDRNTGYSNAGDRNTGYSNTGNRNTGNWNTGDSNTGYSNTGDRNTGVFCTGEKYIKFFNKESKWTEQDFLDSRVYSLLCEVNTKIWIYPSEMTEEEKNANPSYKTCDGYLKDIPFKDAFQNKWHNWSEENKKEFTKLPNFDAKIFEEITGVKVEVKKKKK
jgi:hypothetical protein